MPLRVSALVVALTACTPRVDPIETSSPEPAPSQNDPACELQRAVVREQTCGDEPDCELDELPCSHTLDLDGDGAADRVELTQAGEGIAVRVRFGHGGEVTVGAEPTPVSEYLEPDDRGRMLDPDWSWIVAWEPAVREGDALVVGRHRFEAGAALGGGLWLSGGDAAAMLVLTEAGFEVIELGY